MHVAGQVGPDEMDPVPEVVDLAQLQNGEVVVDQFLGEGLGHDDDEF